jgi:ubiquinone/menaquinone biosynthesis C-methylase UbiE
MEDLEEMFDVIIFSSSFMIMPDRVKALEIAKKRLNPNGSIFFLLTLEHDQTSLRYKISIYMKKSPTHRES